MDNSSNCALCEKPIVATNNSNEHIVPHSIGGRRKIRSFICIDCNSRSGDSWDAEIWQQFSHLAMMHGVERERGTPPDIKIQTIDGEHYLLLPDGQQYDLVETGRTFEGMTHKPIEDPDIYRVLVDAAQIAHECSDLRAFERVRPRLDLARFRTCPACLDRFDRREDCPTCVGRGFVTKPAAAGLP